MTSRTFSFRKNRWLIILAIAVLVLMTVISATHQNGNLRSGSTYSHSPDGYGAWYAYSQQQGIALKPWQKPFSSLAKQPGPITLLRIQSQIPKYAESIDGQEREWLEKGNRLINVGTFAPVSEANFHTSLLSSEGLIRIDGRRRKNSVDSVILGDRFGAVIWREAVGKGEIIWVTTPYLAANAYQDYPQNFQLLTNLVSQGQTTIWVDEYLHGYKDADTIREEVAQTVWHYFLRTPLLILFLQALVVLIFILWSGNRRFGQAISVTPAIRNNSEVYIRALASVLEKAESVEFVVNHLSQAEQKQLRCQGHAARTQLGLGDNALSNETLLTVWKNQTQQSNLSLRSLLNSQKIPRNNIELKLWLEQWQLVQKIPRD
jgi:hypothetical protein